MVRLKNPDRLLDSGGTKPGRGAKFKQEKRRRMREEWAEFCTKKCPHPGRLCDKRPCKEFSDTFGKRRDA